MHGDEIHALAGLFFDFSEQVVRLHAADVALGVQDLLAHGIHGHRAQGQGAGLEHALADGVQISGDGQVHDRVGPGVQGGLDLAVFGFRAVAERRRAEVGVDLDPGGLSHQDGPEPLMGRVAQKHHAALFQGAGDGFGGQALLLGQGGQMPVEQAAQGGVFRAERR